MISFFFDYLTYSVHDCMLFKVTRLHLITEWVCENVEQGWSISGGLRTDLAEIQPCKDDNEIDGKEDSTGRNVVAAWFDVVTSF